MKKIYFLTVFFVATNCFALTSDEFESKFTDLNLKRQAASMNFYFNSKDYEDPNVSEEDKLKSKQGWCQLTKARLNLLEFTSNNFSEYKDFVKRTNQEDDSTLADMKKFSRAQHGSYTRLKDQLKNTEYKCD